MTRTITKMEFIVDFPWIRTNIFNTIYEGATLIGFYQDENPAGLAILKRNETYLEMVDMIYHPDLWTDFPASCCGELLDAAIGMAEEMSLPMLVCLPVERDCAQFIALLSEKGFARDTDKRLVLCIADGATKERLYVFLNRRGNAYIKRLEKKGFVNIAYRDLTQEQKEYVHDATVREFQRASDPRQGRLPFDDENSFFTFHNGSLVSFCLVFRVSPSQLVFEYLAVKGEYKNTGAFLMPLVSFITNTFEYDCKQSISFVYHVENWEMESICNRMLSIVIHSIKSRFCYYYYPHCMTARGRKGRKGNNVL